MPGFRGTLTIGAETLVLEEAQPSKKDARQILAERGVEVAERMEARVRGGSEGGEGGSGGNENWIGKLLGRFIWLLLIANRPFHRVPYSTSSPPFLPPWLPSAFPCTFLSPPH